MKKKRVLVMLLMLGVLITTGCQKKDESKNYESDSQTEKRNLNYSKMTENELEVASYDGDGDAALELGRRYDFGIDVKSNFQEAMSWYQVANDNGNKMASVYLGYLYMNGLGTEKDLTKAMECFDKAISNNEIEGYSGLARVYLENKDLENAPTLCYNNAKKAYDEKSPMGTFLMAYLSETGYGTQTNLVGAKELYKKLADSNFNNLNIYESYPYCEAAIRLGILYTQPTATDEEKEKSIEYFTKAASKNYAKAYYYVGASYQSGINVEKNSEQAVNNYTKAADMKYAPALNQLGYMYFNGYGVDENVKKAISYFKLAAAQNYAPAQVNLGYIYENGYGEEKDLKLAKQYYELAQKSNYDGSIEAITRVDQLINEANAS
jgi:TPR repeat protein